MREISIETPTLIVDEARVRRNIAFMAEKARRQGVRLRPHFKTHQSAAIGDWFRQAGVEAITVSSVQMAQYFARHGWRDITIAFPFNVRQSAAINALAQQVRLGILVESPEALAAARQKLHADLDLWFEIDDGSGRSGLDWQGASNASISALLDAVGDCPNLHPRGLLTHAGRIYRARGAAEIRQVYQETVERMQQARRGLALELSVGDTPGCTLADDLGAVDEIRPGNFVFYDVQQLMLGVCRADQIALAVACPVVAKYPSRQEVVIYGGAVHLSKDTVLVDGQAVYGLAANGPAALPCDAGWGDPLPGASVARLTQEHGVLRLPSPWIDQIKIGDLLYVLPAHSCLAVSALGAGGVLTLDGQLLPTLHSPA